MAPDLVDAPPVGKPTLDHLIAQDAQALSAQLTSIRQRMFPPAAQKTLRQFSSGEAAALIGISSHSPARLQSPIKPRPADASTRLSKSTIFAECYKEGKVLNTSRVAREPSTCRFSPSPTSRAVQARRRLPHICHSSWHSEGTGYSRSTWTRSQACPHFSDISPKPMWEKTKPSTAPCDMMTNDGHCGRWPSTHTSLASTSCRETSNSRNSNTKHPGCSLANDGRVRRFSLRALRQPSSPLPKHMTSWSSIALRSWDF
jgi:hypothetical protein